jgi:hypothetical protein
MPLYLIFILIESPMLQLSPLQSLFTQKDSFNPVTWHSALNGSEIKHYISEMKAGH